MQSLDTTAYCYTDGTPNPGLQPKAFKPPPACASCGLLPGRSRAWGTAADGHI